MTRLRAPQAYVWGVAVSGQGDQDKEGHMNARLSHDQD